MIAAPSRSLSAAAGFAEAAGVEVRILGDAQEGEARALAAEQARMAIGLRGGERPVLLLSGGECTVTRRVDGIGGPNAEYTLAAALALNSAEGIHVLACDTDGVNGAAEIAGAYVGPGTLELARAKGIEPAAALARNDKRSYLGAIGQQVVTGPTLTNVNDFRVVLILAKH